MSLIDYVVKIVGALKPFDIKTDIEKPVINYKPQTNNFYFKCYNQHKVKVVSLKKTKKNKAGAPLFTGNVTIQSPISEGDGADINIGYVHFPKNVKNKFHKHSNDQILIVTEGKGFFETKDKRYILKEGDVAWSPAGEVHSHGALADEKFTHITVTRAKTRLTQVEK